MFFESVNSKTTYFELSVLHNSHQVGSINQEWVGKLCKQKIYLSWNNLLHTHTHTKKTSNQRTSRIGKPITFVSKSSFLPLYLILSNLNSIHHNLCSFQILYPPLCKYAIFLATVERTFLSTNLSMGLMQQLNGNACGKENWISFAGENKPKQTSTPWRLSSPHTPYVFLRVFYFEDFQ